ncbi:SusC/RagA family TonB-linked outer membrane protein [Sphingobacterium bovistauri]|uniref:SusC/RagA family TonB-linked outer membrane protein n=1 Tax=Sphingobacterium bovistauri TaxID=2781959 RepID=A0ABS7Z134_9SPHI|nr:SusC/RagA family TonB-linked outer membrane protein [Sphingobacterium bovistauri]MCA5003868.1 SusC/RagA family TonB-linked outer membrane protein [Sphingobacterium bovistauri]
MRNNAKCLYTIILTAVFLFGLLPVYGQSTIKGRVVSIHDKKPIQFAVVSIINSNHSIQTNAEGSFTFNDIKETPSSIRVWSPGYYETVVDVLGRSTLEILLIAEGKSKYDNIIEGTFSKKNNSYIKDYDFRSGAVNLENLLNGEFTGLRVTNKSGMVSEGASMNFRGVRTFEADNSPLIVLDGMPYLPDNTNSPIIGSYSKSALNFLNVGDIKSVRFLKGAEAAQYGSLSSNGVLYVETSSATDMETVIEFKGSYGIAHNYVKIPVLGVSDFKSYIGNVGMTQYDDMSLLLNRFPFLRDDPNYHYNYLYNNNTDWQDLIYRNAFVTDNHLRVKGGDAIAKYDLSLGIMDQNGALDKTSNTRYSTRLNSQIAFGPKFDFNASVGLSYTTARLQEQGLLNATNPLISAMQRAPVLAAYKKDSDNNLLPDFDNIGTFGVTNPIALLHSGDVSSDMVDIFLNTRLTYKLSQHLHVNGTFGLFSNYVRQTVFIPGLSNNTVVPLENGVALNTARAGAGRNSNIYVGGNLTHNKFLNVENWRFGVGAKALISSEEYDAGQGRNTSSDFYRTLAYVNAAGRKFWGYNESWNWLNMYAFSSYTIKNHIEIDATLNVDGSSVSGSTAERFGIFPAVDVSFLLHNYGNLKNSQSLNNLILKLGYADVGNSRFSSKIGQSYYSSQLYRQLGGIIVGNIPNSDIRWEKNQNLQANLIFSGFNRRVNFNLGYYYNISSDLLNVFPVSPIAGIDKVYVNGGQINNHGLEAELALSVLSTDDWSIDLSGNISQVNSTIEKLVGNQSLIYNQEGGVFRVNAIGSSPYAFYGHEFQGVIASQSAASSYNLKDYRNQSFNAGDALFNDVNNDGVIDNADKMAIGSNLPDFFGGASLSVRYKNFGIQGYFSFTKGNMMYNGLRRNLESQDNYGNQTLATLNRWQTDGQITDIPKVQYGDPMENGRFSSRWIEDASHVRFDNLIASYKLGKSKYKFLSNSEWYVAGENLMTWSNYLGLDPVTAYSSQIQDSGLDYGKVALPRTFRLGVNIKL